MKSFKVALGAIFGLFLIGSAYTAVTAIPRFANGFALQDGTKLNLMVDALNTINSAQAVFAGQKTLTGTNPSTVATGLTTILGCTLGLVSTVSPSTTTVVSYGKSGGTLSIYGWTYTTTSNNTLIASTSSTDVIGWICSGTK